MCQPYLKLGAVSAALPAKEEAVSCCCRCGNYRHCFVSVVGVGKKQLPSLQPLSYLFYVSVFPIINSKIRERAPLDGIELQKHEGRFPNGSSPNALGAVVIISGVLVRLTTCKRLTNSLPKQSLIICNL